MVGPARIEEKDRVKQLTALAPKEGRKATLERDQFYSAIKFDVFQADSFGRAEFYVHTIITKIKYLVTNTGWNGHRPKADIELGNLIEEAEKEYKRKVLRIGKRKR